jgi:hypothetical protein
MTVRKSFKLREEALDHTLWRTGLGSGYGPVVTQTRTGMNECNMKAADICDVMEPESLTVAGRPPARIIA